jgi:hypothetical protein
MSVPVTKSSGPQTLNYRQDWLCRLHLRMLFLWMLNTLPAESNLRCRMAQLRGLVRGTFDR